MQPSENAPAEGSSRKDLSFNRISGWRRIVLWPLSILIRIWSGTTKIEISPNNRALLSDTSRPVLILFWHNRLFLAAHVFRKFRSQSNVWGLVSASRDGAWLAAFLSLMGIGSVRGSTSRRAFGATRELIERFNDGGDIAITPDGPRGPRYQFRIGAVRLARKTRAPLLLASAKYERFWRLGSWDGFYLPKPFSKFHLRVTRIESYHDLKANSETEAADILRQKLLELSL